MLSLDKGIPLRPDCCFPSCDALRQRLTRRGEHRHARTEWMVAVAVGCTPYGASAAALTSGHAGRGGPCVVARGGAEVLDSAAANLDVDLSPFRLALPPSHTSNLYNDRRCVTY